MPASVQKRAAGSRKAAAAGAAAIDPGVAAGVPRATRQRAALRRVIDASPHPLLPAELLERVQQEIPAFGMATVYRNLKLLMEGGEIRLVELPGAAPRYESARHAHHHHFQCRICARVFDIHGCPGDLAALAPRGFKVDEHDLTLYGSCADCGSAARKARR